MILEVMKSLPTKENRTYKYGGQFEFTNSQQRYLTYNKLYDIVFNLYIANTHTLINFQYIFKEL